MLLKHVYMGWKFQRTLKLDISFTLEHFFISVAIFTQVASASLSTLTGKKFTKIWFKVTLSTVNTQMMLSLPFPRSNSRVISFSVTILIVLLSQTLLSFGFGDFHLSVPVICFMTSGCLFIRVQQWAYILYVHIPTFIGVHMISDISTLTRTLNFSLWFFKVFKIFLVLIIFLLFKNLLLYVWSLPLEETYSSLFTFLLKKPYFSMFHTNYSVNIFPYLRALANLECQEENKLK